MGFLRTLTTLTLTLALLSQTSLFVQSSQTPGQSIQSILLVEEGALLPKVSNNANVQVAPGIELQRRDVRSLSQLLQGFIGWPASEATIQTLSRAMATWGERNRIYFTLMAPSQLSSRIKLRLAPRPDGPSYLSYYGGPGFQPAQPTWNSPERYSSYPRYGSSWIPGRPGNLGVDLQPPHTRGARGNAVYYPTNAPIEMGSSYSSSTYPAPTASTHYTPYYVPATTSSQYPRRAMPVDVSPAQMQTIELYPHTIPIPPSTEERLRNLEAERNELKNKIDDLSKQVEAAKEIEETAKKLSVERDKLKTSLDAVTQELVTTRKEADRLQQVEKDRDDLKKKLDTLSQQMANAQKIQDRLKQLEADREQLKAMLDILSEELITAHATQERIRRVESQRSHINTLLQSLGKEPVDDLDSGNQDVRAQRAEFERQLEMVPESSRELARRIQKLEGDKADLKAELDAMTAEVIDSRLTEEKLQEIQAERNQLQALLNEVSRDLLDAEKARRYIANLEMEKDKLLQQVSQLQKEADGLKTYHADALKYQSDYHYENLVRQNDGKAGVTIDTVPENTPAEQEGQIVTPEPEPLTEGEFNSSPIVRQVTVVGDSITTARVRELRGPEGTVAIDVPEITSIPARRKITQAAQRLIGKPFSVNLARQMGIEIGETLSEFDMPEYEVILPRQDMAEGALDIVIRKKE